MLLGEIDAAKIEKEQGTMRITKTISNLSPIRERRPIEVTIDGRKAQAFKGELVSTVLQAEGIVAFARKSTTGRLSGIYCGMGVCYECLVTIDGVPNVRACQTYASDQMAIETANRGKL
jgi:predicted molibdopterin-dependent oxidoreductase YjgC